MISTRRELTLEQLLDNGKWKQARARIEGELKRDPENHWLLTQKGMTLYEEGRYEEALLPLKESLGIVPDCPLTLWNLAGAFDALGRSDVAMKVYSSLLESEATFADDACWESQEWTESLKADCTFRLGVCFSKVGKNASADHCFRRYIDLKILGVKGLASIDEAADEIRRLGREGTNGDGVGTAIAATLKEPGVRSIRVPLRSLSPIVLRAISNF